MEWTDATSYSRDAKNKIQTAWELKLPNVKIYITNNHTYYKGEIVMHCFQLGIDTKYLNLPADKVEEAKEKALNIVKEKINAIVKDINSIN